MADTNDLTQNVTLFDNAKAKNVTVITDGANERLAVDADISGGNFQLQPMEPVVVVDTTGVTTNASTWDTIVNFTGEGRLDFVALSSTLSSYRVRVTIDAVEIFDLAMSDLNALGLSNATNVPLWAETADKNFRYHPTDSGDFITSLKIEVMSVTATPVVKSLISYRKVV